MSYIYAYITLCLILLLFWLFIFLMRKDLRREMLWASFWGMPLGFVDFFLVPAYWHPDSLFDLIKNFGVGIESFIFTFVMAGLASVIYEFFYKEKPVKLVHGGGPHFWLLLVTTLAFVGLSMLFPTKAIYNLMLIGAAGAIVTIYLRRDLWKQIIASGFIFSFLYLGIFALVNFIFSGFIEHAYNLKNTWGILVLGIPLEEMAGAFFAGAFWSSLYEYTKAYREQKLN